MLQLTANGSLINRRPRRSDSRQFVNSERSRLRTGDAGRTMTLQLRRSIPASLVRRRWGKGRTSRPNRRKPGSLRAASLAGADGPRLPPSSDNFLHDRVPGGGRQHSDPFPLPRPRLGSFWDRSPYQVFTPSDLHARGVSPHGLARVAEGVDVLNSLSSSSAASARRSSELFSGHQAKGKATMTQQSVLENMLDGVRHYGPCPVGLTPKACFEEVIKCSDF